MDRYELNPKEIYDAILTNNRSVFDDLINKCGNASMEGKTVVFGKREYKDSEAVADLKKSLERVYTRPLNVMAYINHVP